MTEPLVQTGEAGQKVVRQAPVQALAGISARLYRLCRDSAQPEGVNDAMAHSLRAECIGCGIQLNGADLLRLGEGAPLDSKLDRVRLGYCARNTCQSLYYSLHCDPHPLVSWDQLWDSLPDAGADEPEEVSPDEQELCRRRNRTRVWQLAAVAAAILIIFCFWQLYFGGSIPVLREAEVFEVDPLGGQPHYEQMLTAE